jgi:signal transduction histidine kinase
MPIDVMIVAALAVCSAAIFLAAFFSWRSHRPSTADCRGRKDTRVGMNAQSGKPDLPLGRELRELIESLPDSIARYDRHCSRIYANPAFMKMVAGPEGGCGERMLCDCGKDYQRKVGEVLASGMDEELECAWKTSSGITLISHVRFIPERDAAGAVVGVTTIGRDISELKDTEHRLRESRALLRELTARREIEEGRMRKNIAREMHEEYGQSLSALRMTLVLMKNRHGAVLPELERSIVNALELLDDAILQTRTMVTALHPSVLNIGIASALEWLADECMASTGVHHEVRVGEDIDMLDETATRLVFKIVQLALSNVARHAAANMVCVTLYPHGELYRLEVRDDGNGFDLDQSRKEALGLVAMEALSHTLGGEIVFLSQPGKGTIVEVCFPPSTAVQRPLFEAA